MFQNTCWKNPNITVNRGFWHCLKHLTWAYFNSIYNTLQIMNLNIDPYIITYKHWTNTSRQYFSVHLSAVYIRMVLSIVTTVLMELSSIQFWCDAPDPLNTVFCYFLKKTSIKSDSVWYAFIITPWLWASFSKVAVFLTVSVEFIYTWCLVLIKPLACSKKTHL